MLEIKRHPQNPIVIPGEQEIRKVVTFNPGAIYDNNKFYLYDRAAVTLSPFRTTIGILESDNGVDFKPLQDKPVFTSEKLGFPEGSVQDPRVVKIEGKYYMNYAFQPYGFNCYPTGEGVPFYDVSEYPKWEEEVYPMITRSGIAVSDDGINFKQLCYTSPKEIDDRDHILFPEKIKDKFALLRRPIEFVGEEYGTDRPGIWICFSDDLHKWSKPVLIARSEEQWEGKKIGAAANPIKTNKGWLVMYHGVDTGSVYKVGALLLDLEDPTIVIARTKNYIMEPEEYYEKVGLIIPNVVFPTSLVEKDGLLYIYYGACDTSICLATVKTEDLVNHILAPNS
ncbi:glycosidase [Polaribacter reichenbachii]|uniref:Glycosidase n=1 Tax=Polaribacter reichenbachii TaxID=996801 RepID=A0A1B8U4Y8_9FLAO|nr:glycosidase [Polaribacter reichenbachii]APZ44771.1 glycosidase [Polaribacter reichenbachii]AUC18635.1 glycosidase [Polaribacter reichenbachii]OBY66930.1 glycosidase [Polaribacter reichenbachii]